MLPAARRRINVLDRQPSDQEAFAAIAKMPELSLRRMEALVQSASLYRNERSSSPRVVVKSLRSVTSSKSLNRRAP